MYLKRILKARKENPNASYIQVLSECWAVHCYYDDDVFAARWENPYLNSGFMHPNFIYPRRRALSLPFLGACPAKKIQSFPLAFLPFKFLFLLKQKQEEKITK